MTQTTQTHNNPAVHSIGVRELAEVVHRRGDIHLRYDRSTTGAEGIATQRKWQQGRGASYQREVSVQHDFAVHYGIDGHTGVQPCEVRGRIDGCDLTSGLVEEYKTTRATIDLVHAHAGDLHLAQLRLYGGLLALSHPDIPEFTLQLCYCHPEEGVVKTHRFGAQREELVEFLEHTLETYRHTLVDHLNHQLGRNRQIAGLAFPFKGEFRPNQRALAGRSYLALCKGDSLLLEAGTGTGKTLGVLYPAVKALADANLDSVFFLSSRSTGQDAAQKAATLLKHAQLRQVTIIAREKACLVEGMPCTPQACDYARGYYDRVRPAVAELLSRQDGSPEGVARIALKHQVCPFELSLDASLWCDLVVMDYNYLFDPQVRLQRLATRPNTALLIDEAHQLSDRVRDMLSAQLERRQIDAAIASDTELAGRIRKTLVSLGRSFSRVLNGAGDVAQRDAQIEFPAAFSKRLQAFADELSEHAAPGEPIAAGDDALLSLYFAALRWQRALEWTAADNRALFVRHQRKRLELVCLDPADHINATLERYGPNIRFSGTLTPLSLYRSLHGQEHTELVRAAPSENGELGLFIVPNIPTYYQQRSRSLPALVRLVRDTFAARAGNYFVAFPSYAYLNTFVDAFRFTHPEIELVTQTNVTTTAERQAFIDQFRSSDRPLLGAVVLGGVFTESLDFTGEALVGMIVAGVALPPPDLSRDAIAAHFDAKSASQLNALQDADQGGAMQVGQDVAYRAPAMIRVVQAAGRVVRGPGDKGIVCLVDERFLRPEFARFAPAHWQPQVVPAQTISHTLQQFWHPTGGSAQ